MIRANVKSARPTAIIDSLQEFNQHEIIAVAKLDRADEHMNERQPKDQMGQKHELIKIILVEEA